MTEENNKDIKVVFTGQDLIEGHNFNIVKIGSYSVDQAGALTALKEGIFDKYKKDAPNFEVKYFRLISSETKNAKKIDVFVFVFEEFEDEYLTVISGKVVFTERLEEEMDQSVFKRSPRKKVVDGNI